MLPEHPRKGRCTAANAHLRLRLTAARSCPGHRTRTKHWKAAAKSIVATAVSHAGPTPSSPSIRLSRERPLNVQRSRRPSFSLPLPTYASAPAAPPRPNAPLAVLDSRLPPPPPPARRFSSIVLVLFRCFVGALVPPATGVPLNLSRCNLKR